MVSTYDSKVLQRMADRLNRQANSVVRVWGLLGFLGGLWLGYALARNVWPTLICGLLAAAICGAIGDARALRLRVEAQQLLVWVEIERNTRRI